MAVNVDLKTLRTRARQRADMENSGFVKDSELNTFINSSIRELYDLLISKFGDDYYLTDSTISLTVSTDTYDLPTDFYKLVGADLLISPTDEPITLQPFMFAERNRYRFRNGTYFYGDSEYKYRIMGNSIKFIPQPNNNYQAKLWYIPAFTELEVDSDEFDGINGYEEWVIIDAAIKMLVKEESDTQQLERAKAQQTQRIENAAANRDVGMPQTISDVHYLNRHIRADEDYGI